MLNKKNYKLKTGEEASRIYNPCEIPSLAVLLIGSFWKANSAIWTWVYGDLREAGLMSSSLAKRRGGLKQRTRGLSE